MLLGPDAVEQGLRNKDKAFANQPAWTRLVGPFFGGGLMLIDFEEHHAHRRIMQEAFTRDRLETYAARMHPAIATGMADWGTDPEFLAYPALKQLTLDIAADIFMGGAESTSREEMDRVNEAFIACVQAAAGIVRADVPFTRWGRAYRGRRVLEDFLRGYLPARRATRTDDIFSVLCHIETERRRAVHRRRRRQPHDLPDDGRPRHLDHHHLDDPAVPRPAPRVAGALPPGVAGARPRADAWPSSRRCRRSTW